MGRWGICLVNCPRAVDQCFRLCMLAAVPSMCAGAFSTSIPLIDGCCNPAIYTLCASEMMHTARACQHEGVRGSTSRSSSFLAFLHSGNRTLHFCASTHLVERFWAYMSMKGVEVMSRLWVWHRWLACFVNLLHALTRSVSTPWLKSL